MTMRPSRRGSGVVEQRETDGGSRNEQNCILFPVGGGDGGGLMTIRNAAGKPTIDLMLCLGISGDDILLSDKALVVRGGHRVGGCNILRK